MPSARFSLTTLFALAGCCLLSGCVSLTPPWSNEIDASPTGVGSDSASVLPRAEVASRDKTPGDEATADVVEAAAGDAPTLGREVSSDKEDGRVPVADSSTGAGGVMGSGGSLARDTGGAAGAGGLPAGGAPGSGGSLAAGTGGAAGAGGLPAGGGDAGADRIENQDSFLGSGGTSESDGATDPHGAAGTGGATGLVLVKLTGVGFGSGPAYSGNPTATYDKALDGDITTSFDDSNDSGGYAGIDLGNGRTATVSAIRFYPRKDFNDRMAGGKFQCSVSSQTDSYVDLHTIAIEPPLAWTEVSVANSPACRFLRYLGPTGGSTNVAEIEFWAMDTPDAGRGIGHTDAGAPLTNFALGKPAQASSEQTSAGKTADQGNDGLVSTSFCPASGDFPIWYQIDLGATYPIRQTDVTVEISYATYQYQIDVSGDGSSWTSAVNHQADAVFGPPTLADSFQAQARYVRLTITGATNSAWGCVREFSVWGFDKP
jgi:F5/8 type C domain